MGEGHVTVFRIGEIKKHPNADTLSITQALGGYPVILRTGDYAEGDLAVYIPVDSVVPDTPEWAFLGGHRCIGAKRLRGVFSMGMLAKAPEGTKEGDEVGAQLGIVRWEDTEEAARARASRGPDADPDDPKGYIPVYDLEGYRRWIGQGVFQPGEEVVLTEKIHGESARFYHDGTRFWVGSLTEWKRLDGKSRWAVYAAEHNLADVMAETPGVVVYAELYGSTTELKYDAGPQRKVRVFDVFGTVSAVYHDYDDMVGFACAHGFETMPVVYRGPWNDELVALAEGQSLLGDHVREGWVGRPVRERVHLTPHTKTGATLGRVVLKYHGEGFLTRKRKADRS